MALKYFLTGKLEECFTFLNELLITNQTNSSVVHNVIITEWYRDHNLVEAKRKLQKLTSTELTNTNDHNLLYVLNLCAIYFFNGELEEAKDILLSHLNSFRKSFERLKLRYIFLLAEIIFTLVENNYASLLSSHVQWNVLLDLLTDFNMSLPNHVTFRLHLLQYRYHIATSQYKSAKKELKMAMELYNHQLKNMNPGDFAKSLCLYHFNLPLEMMTLVVESINLTHELLKEGCIVYFLKVFQLLILIQVTI